MIAYRNDGLGNKNQFGDDIAEGFVRAAKKWGRLEGNNGDMKTGVLAFPYWGIPMHRDPRTQLEWGYGSILGDRDANEHDFDALHWDPTEAKWSGRKPLATAEEAVKIYTDKMVPYQSDRLMLDYSNENMYSEHIAKLVAWHRHYTRFWKQSMLLCDWQWPDFLNLHAPDKVGSTGEAEPKFFNAVTGKKLSFLDGLEIGRKIWNLDHAIWTLQGRHRDIVHFADFVYTTPASPVLRRENHLLPGRIDGEWTYFDALGRSIDKEQFEDFKTKFYRLVGWDITTGFPKRSTLESLDLGYVADVLESQNKLGKE
jgi:aldehyde:ferredoxin oxidoreductase